MAAETAGRVRILGPSLPFTSSVGFTVLSPTHACHPHSYRSMIKKSTTTVPDSSQDLVVSREQRYPGVILWGEQWSVTPDPVTTNDLPVGQSFVSPLVGPLVSAPHQGHCGGLDETPPRLRCVGGAICGDLKGAALLEEVCHQGVGFESLKDSFYFLFALSAPCLHLKM